MDGINESRMRAACEELGLALFFCLPYMYGQWSFEGAKEASALAAMVDLEIAKFWSEGGIKRSTNCQLSRPFVCPQNIIPI